MTILGQGDCRYLITGEEWGDLPPGWIYRDATAVAVDSKDNAVVFNRGGHPVIVFDKMGGFVRSFGEGVFSFPHGVAIGPDDEIYCVDAGDHTLRKFSSDGTLLLTIGVPGKPSSLMGGAPFNKPTHVSVDYRDGCMYVSDGYSNAHVHKFSPDGKLMFSWGGSGTEPGLFNIVHNLAVGRDGRVYVADRENRRIQIFDSEGKYLDQWNNLSRTGAVCLSQTEPQKVFIGEYFGGIVSNAIGNNLGPRISIYTTSGELIERLGHRPIGDEPGQFFAPHGIAVDTEESIYVAEVPHGELGNPLMPSMQYRSLQKLTKC